MSGPISLALPCNNYALPSLSRPSATSTGGPGESDGLHLKRKRSKNGLGANLPQSIIINPFPITSFTPTSTSVSDQAETYVPIQLLRRSSLPFSFLDSVCSISAGPLSRLFSARSTLLNFLRGDGAGTEPVVLIVISRVDERLYAIEDATSQGTYALCRLAYWVTKRDVEILGLEEDSMACRTVEQTGRKRERMAKLNVNKSNWWHAAALPRPQAEPLAKKRRLNGPVLKMEMSHLQKVKVEDTIDSVDAVVSHPFPPPLQKEKEMKTKEPTPSHAAVIEDPKMTLSGDELTGNLIQHYLDALYLSRTSLAYFAKGPLSRLRGAAGGEGRVLSLLDLSDFLRSAMLTPSLLEKKYKETLPGVIKEVYVSDDDDDDDGSLSTPSKAIKRRERQKKRRKRRLLRPGKNGLFPDEGEMIRKWWLSCDRSLAATSGSSSASPFKSKIEAMKVRLATLRLREIFAQIIIALEILAVEGSSAFADERKMEDASGQGDVAHNKNKSDKSEDACSKQHGKKKRQNIQLVLDLLVDKLCIWRSVEQQVSGFKDSSRSEDALPGGNAKNISESFDLLSNFCVEVIIPFYVHRLPNIASSLSSKLGGPKAPTPDRRSLSSLASASKTASRPGDPATRQVQLDQRRKIARVASETLGGQRHNQRPGIGSRNGSGSGIKDNNNNNNGPKRIATLSRSATDTIVPVLKREAESEGNELSLASIPASRRRVGARDSVPSRSHALSQCQRLSQREVDFDAMTKSRSNLAAAAGSGGGNAATSAKNGSNDGGRTTEDARRLQKNKRMEFVDVQLQEAISAIKKPDRRAAVGKEFEKEVERRGGLKVKGKATVRNGPGKGQEKLPSQQSYIARQTVQVTATPKHPRPSATIMMHHRCSYGEGQNNGTQNPSFQGSIPISFSPTRVRIDEGGQSHLGQGEDCFAADEGFIPSSTIRPTMSKTQPLPLSPIPMTKKMGDGYFTCISTDTLVTKNYSKVSTDDHNHNDNATETISSSPPTLSLQASFTRNLTVDHIDNTPSRHTNTKRFILSADAREHWGEKLSAVSAAASGVCPDTPAFLSRYQDHASTGTCYTSDTNSPDTANDTSFIIRHDNENNNNNNQINSKICPTKSSNNTRATVTGATTSVAATATTPVSNRTAILSTRRDNGNAQSIPTHGRNSTCSNGGVGKRNEIHDVHNVHNIYKFQDNNDDDDDGNEDVCVETPSRPCQNRQRLQQQQRRKDKKVAADANPTNIPLYTPTKPQKRTSGASVANDVDAGRKRRSNGLLAPLAARARATARAAAVLIPAYPGLPLSSSSSFSSSSPAVSSAAASSVRRTVPSSLSSLSSSPLVHPASGCAVEAMAASHKLEGKTGIKANAPSPLFPPASEPASTPFSASVVDEENIYAALGWE